MASGDKFKIYGIIYESMTIASQKLNIPLSGISNCCSGKLKQTKGYNFAYFSDGFIPLLKGGK